MTRLLFTGGKVFDGTGSGEAHGDVVVEDHRIVEVGVGLDGDVAVDTSGCTLLAGFIDCHVHVLVDHVNVLRHLETPFSYKFYVAARNLAALLHTGVTTARDAAGADLGIKQALTDRLIAGPRLHVSLSLLSQTGGHGDYWMPSGFCPSMLSGWPGVPDNIVDGPDEMRRKVRELVRAGADQIKVCSSGGVMSPSDDPTHAHFTLDELEVAVAEASAAGTYVMAHAQATQGIKNAVLAGIRSIEHGVYLDDEAIALMLERGTYLVPTLMAPLSVLEAIEQGALVPEAAARKVRGVVEVHRESVRRAIDAEVPIAMGTDAVGIPMGRNLEELEHLASLGMPPADVLRSATATAARLLRLEDRVGTVAPGMEADLVVVEGDATDLSGLRDRIAGVWQAGRGVAGKRAQVAP